MKQILIVGLLLGSSVVGCSGSNAAFDGAAGSEHLRLELACSSNSDCPATFECEAETEHGATSTFCSSIDTVKPDGSGAKCPAGYEVEQEHGISFCKAHGSDGAKHGGSDDGAGGSDGSGHDATDDHGAGGDGDAAEHEGTDDRGAGGSGSDDRPGHDGADDGVGGSDDAAGHDAADDQAAGGNHDGGGDSHHGKDG